MFRCLIFKIEPRENPTADAIVGEGLHGEDTEVASLSPPGVQNHPVALLRGKVGKSLVPFVPAQAPLDVLLWLVPLAEEVEVDDFHGLFSQASLLEQREAYLEINSEN